MLCIELLVVGQAGLVFIQFIVGVIIENTCSPEMKHLKRLQQQREQARKRASARSKRRYRQAFHLAALDSKKNLYSSSKHGKLNEIKPPNVPQTTIQSEKQVNLKANDLQPPLKPKALMKSENKVKRKRGKVKRKSTFVL